MRGLTDFGAVIRARSQLRKWIRNYQASQPPESPAANAAIPAGSKRSAAAVQSGSRKGHPYKTKGGGGSARKVARVASNHTSTRTHVPKRAAAQRVSSFTEVMMELEDDDDDDDESLAGDDESEAGEEDAEVEAPAETEEPDEAPIAIDPLAMHQRLHETSHPGHHTLLSVDVDLAGDEYGRVSKVRHFFEPSSSEVMPLLLEDDDSTRLSASSVTSMTESLESSLRGGHAFSESGSFSYGIRTPMAPSSPDNQLVMSAKRANNNLPVGYYKQHASPVHVEASPPYHAQADPAACYLPNASCGLVSLQGSLMRTAAPINMPSAATIEDRQQGSGGFMYTFGAGRAAPSPSAPAPTPAPRMQQDNFAASLGVCPPAPALLSHGSYQSRMRNLSVAPAIPGVAPVNGPPPPMHDAVTIATPISDGSMLMPAQYVTADATVHGRRLAYFAQDGQVVSAHHPATLAGCVVPAVPHPAEEVASSGGDESLKALDLDAFQWVDEWLNEVGA